MNLLYYIYIINIFAIIFPELQIHAANNAFLRIKAPGIPADDESSQQSQLVKIMQQRFDELSKKIPQEEQYVILVPFRNLELQKRLKIYLEDLVCLMLRKSHKPSDLDLYDLLKKDYDKDTEGFESVFKKLGIKEIRAENIPFAIKRYALLKKIDPCDYIKIGEIAASDDSLSPLARSSFRDIINFLQNPISRETFAKYCESRSAVESIIFSNSQIKLLNELYEKAQEQLNMALQEQVPII